jgi:uncharacterized membrane protein YcgQ (UPF0703/DUF1980 family)
MWYIFGHLVYFSRFGTHIRKKIWQPCTETTQVKEHDRHLENRAIQCHISMLVSVCKMLSFRDDTLDSTRQNENPFDLKILP